MLGSGSALRSQKELIVDEYWDKSKCCCHCPDSRECFRSRYSVTHDQRGDEEDGDCERACHGEYLQALEDSGIYEDQYP